MADGNHAAVKQRPILFSGPMVRALLAGRKTQTRRGVKLDVPADAHEVFFWSGEELRRQGWRNVSEPGLWARRNGRDGYIKFVGRCPYGVPGDRLWVKETWSDVNLLGGPGIAYRADGHVHDLMDREDFLARDGAFNYDDPRLSFGKAGLRFSVWSADLVGGIEGSWRSPLHMPGWASRLTLEITDIRVERLQNISETDAAAEGLMTWDGRDCDGDPRLDGRMYDFKAWGWEEPKHESDGFMTAYAAYRDLWKHINGKGNWAANPWVWAVTFRATEPA